MDRARIGPKAESRPMSRFRGGVQQKSLRELEYLSAIPQHHVCGQTESSTIVSALPNAEDVPSLNLVSVVQRGYVYL